MANRREVLLSAATGLASAAVLAVPAFAASDARADVKRALDEFFAAAGRRDWDATGHLMSDQFMIWLDGDASFDRPSYIAMLKEDDLKVYSLALHELVIEVSDDRSLAWCRYRAEVDGLMEGKRSVVHTAETIVYEQVKGAWLMRHVHVSLSRNQKRPS